MGVVETFVVRIFVAADTQRLPLVGFVEYVSNGRKETFEGGTELLEIVKRELERNDTCEQVAPQPFGRKENT
jgi:hypothetical protein